MKYMTPELEVVLFENEDIITDSVPACATETPEDVFVPEE